MKPFRLPPLDETRPKELDEPYRTTKNPRIRTRAQMVFLSADQKLIVPQIALIVRENEPTLLRWLKGYHAEGSNGLRYEPRPERPSDHTDNYRARLSFARRAMKSCGSSVTRC